MGKKIKIMDIEIEKMEFPNFGLAYEDGNKIYAKNTLVGQKLQVRAVRRRRKIEATVLEILQKAPNEIDPKCDKFGICGGCTFQNIPYDDELVIKKEMVISLLSKQGIENFEFLGIEGSKEIEGYRNKMEYSFGDEEKGGSLSLGMRKRNSFYEVVTAPHCNIVDEDYRILLKEILAFFGDSEEEFYHKTRHVGTLRNIIIRKGKHTGEILINVVTTSELKADLMELVHIVNNIKLTGKIVGILHTVNNALSDAIICDEFKILYGRDYFFERLFNMEFKISAFSFFQTNTLGAEQLYTTVKEFVGNTENLNIFDLYCGTGTIAQIVSQNAKKVIGVELVKEAVESAKQNAERNGIKNCEFIAGDVLHVVHSLEDAPHTIILDPPRDGVHQKALDKILDFGADKIVYISCKPTSLARDLQMCIDKGYEIKQIKLHDLFPRTYHVESVVLLSRKDG